MQFFMMNVKFNGSRYGDSLFQIRKVFYSFCALPFGHTWAVISTAPKCPPRDSELFLSKPRYHSDPPQRERNPVLKSSISDFFLCVVTAIENKLYNII